MPLGFMREQEHMIPFLRTLPATSFIRRYCAFAVVQNDAPLAYHVALAHALLSSCCSPDLLYRFAGSRVHPALWTLLIGLSRRDRKGTAINIARPMLRAVCPDRHGAHPNSVPAFLEGMAAQPQSTYIYAEMGSFFKMTSDGRTLSDLRLKYMEAFDGTPLDAAVVARSATASGRRRGGGEGDVQRSRSVEFPKMGLWGGIAPALLEEYTSNVDWTGGFMARQTITWAERERDAPFGTMGVSTVKEDSLVQQLTDIAGVQPGICNGFSPAAAARWETWYNDVTHRYQGDFTHEAAVGQANGTPPTVLKLAVLHELDYGAIKGEGPWSVSLECLNNAITYGEQLLLSAIHTTNAVATTGFARVRRSIYDAVAAFEEAPGIPGDWRTLGDVMQRVRPPQPQRMVTDCLRDLETEGLIVKRTRSVGDVWRRRRPTAAAAAAAEEETVEEAGSGDDLV